jgi:hypothetical protein
MLDILKKMTQNSTRVEVVLSTGDKYSGKAYLSHDESALWIAGATVVATSAIVAFRAIGS